MTLLCRLRTFLNTQHVFGHSYLLRIYMPLKLSVKKGAETSFIMSHIYHEYCPTDPGAKAGTTPITAIAVGTAPFCVEKGIPSTLTEEQFEERQFQYFEKYVKSIFYHHALMKAVVFIVFLRILLDISMQVVFLVQSASNTHRIQMGV